MTAMEDLHTLLNYMNHRYSTNKNRHWWAIAHRARLIDTGQYIKTSEQTRCTIKWTTSPSRNMQLINEEVARQLLLSFPSKSITEES